MSIIKSKRDIFNQISVFTSLKEIELKPNNLFNSISSINNSKDVVPYLLDISTSLVGSDGLENKLGLLFTQFIGEYNIKSKELLKQQFLGINSNLQLPNSFVNDGINIPIKSLDDMGNLKTSKTDPLGELIYDDVSDNLTTKLKNSIISPNTPIQYNNVNLIYNNVTDEVNIKPITQQTISNFMGNYINNLPNINKKEIVADILNNIYGIKSTTQNKTYNELLKEFEIDIIVDKLTQEDTNIELTVNDIKNINENAENIIKGFNEIDLGCGIINNKITIDKLINISNDISNSDNPFEIYNLSNNLFLESLDDNTDESNKTNLKDSFIKRLINLLKNRIIKDIIFSPDKKLLFFINKNIESNQLIDFNVDSVDFVNENINLIECVSDEIKSMFIEFIFNLIKTEILEITKPALQKIITEKINNYTLILRSLLFR